MDRKLLLTILILAGLIMGGVFGQLLYDSSWDPSSPESQHAHAGWLAVSHFLGFTVFMGLLKMLIIPLVAVSVFVGVTSVGDFRKLGKLGGWTLVYYFSTMLIAVSLGLVLVNVFQPGSAIGKSQLLQAESSYAQGSGVAKIHESASDYGLFGVFEHLVKLMIPDNIFEALAGGQTLSIIVVSLFFGLVTAFVGKRAKVLVDISDAVFHVLMHMVTVVLWLAPVGVLALLTWTVARIGLGVFGEAIGYYVFTVIFGLAIHGLVVLPAILFLFTGKNPFIFMHQMRAALMTAFGTDSSSATLPVTLETATEFGGIKERVAGLVLPLGSTINMDGTALYEAVAVVFIAQAYGIELGMMQMIIIAVTATLAAVGAAGIPSAGLVTMVIVLETANQSLAAHNPNATLIPLAGIGLIVGVDRIVDMVRTTVNVWGDAVGAKIINRLDLESG